MPDNLFFIFMAISILGYGIHVPLIAYFVRRFDPLLVAVYRNLALSILFAVPLFVFSSFSNLAALGAHLGVLLAAVVTGFLSFMWTLYGIRYLPVGISNAIGRMCNVILAVAFGVFFFGEYLTPVQFVLLVGIVAAAVGLSLLRSDHGHLAIATMGKGVMYSMLAGVGGALTFFFFSILSREVDPFVASFAWETGIGVCALAWLTLQRTRGTYKGLVLLPLRDTALIALASVFVVAGTLGFSLALNHGPFSLATGLSTATVLVVTLISWFLFKERLRTSQMILIAATVVLMFLLKVLS